MNTRITGTDLDQWSTRQTARGELPAIVRELIMFTANPTRISFPSDEATARPGLDGEVAVTGEAGPYVPSGASVWEASTNANPKSKATDDYKKRTGQTSEERRGELTFVFVTSRSWPGAADWIRETTALGHGWKDIRVIEAEDLALWLRTCPGVEAWLAGHLNRPYGIRGLRRWFENWSAFTEPAIPPEVPFAGRREDAIRLLNTLDGPPTTIDLCAGSLDEIVAFIAAVYLLAPTALTDPPEEMVTEHGPERDEIDSADALEDDRVELARMRGGEEIEALLARVVVIESLEAWQRWCQHDRPQILIPLFYPDNVQEAVTAGHHVILPRVTRDARDTGRLSPLSVDDAREAWTAAGVDFRLADDFARSSRRNLGSLRRRIARHPRHRVPAWAEGTAAPLLATALLAGSWDTKADGDVEVLLALTDRASLRALNRDLTALTSGDDPPLIERGKRWEFVDVVDAWDALAGHLSAEDLELFMEQVKPILIEPDPAQDMSAEERLIWSIDPDRPRRRHSGALRRGLVRTLAICGSVIGDARIAGDLTGATLANIVVRDLLLDADGDRWTALSPHLPLLAEASPEWFLNALERALTDDPGMVMTLFKESDDGFGGQRTHHSPLLCALETLAFSPTHLARAAVALARLADLDPGGRLANRPADSLASTLHLAIPQGAVNGTNRLSVLDAVRRASPTAGRAAMTALIKSVNRGMLIRTGPRYREWPPPRTRSKSSEIVETIDEITGRLLEDANAADAWTDVAGLVGHLTPRGRTKTISALSQAWDGIEENERSTITETIRQTADRHRQFPDSAWAMSSDGVAELDEFLHSHATAVDDALAASALFGWTHRGYDRTDEGKLEIDQNAAVTTALKGGIPGVVELASASDLPHTVGYALARVSTTHDDEVLALLDGDDLAARQVAGGLIAVRSKDVGWVGTTVAANPERAARILLSLEATHETLDLVFGLDETQQQLYWASASAHAVADDATERYIDGLIGANRLFAAIDAASLRTEHISAGAVLSVLSAPMVRASDDTIEVLRSPQYEVGRLLNVLEAHGLSSNELADIEWFYLPLLDDQRPPRALHQRLASEPAFYAEVVSHMYKPDPPADGTEEPEDLPDDEYRFSRACWDLARTWTEPPPGAITGAVPDADAMQAWINDVRNELAARNRATVASLAIGDALSGRATDDDGTWPCLAVRVVLENEQDDDLEDQLAISRLNQRGVTTRGMFEGGKQERKLAAKYRAAADKLRDQWPRTGKLLDRIVHSYEADARREDGRAEP